MKSNYAGNMTLYLNVSIEFTRQLLDLITHIKLAENKINWKTKQKPSFMLTVYSPKKKLWKKYCFQNYSKK